jgi:hypothetical protein
MKNFNPYTGNKKVGSAKKKPKATVRKMPNRKGGKLKMAEGGVVDSIKEWMGIGSGMRGKQIDKVVDDADKGINPPQPKKKKKN